MSTYNVSNKSTPKNLRIENDLLEAINSHKDQLVPLSAWIKQACKEKLQRENAPISIQVPLKDVADAPTVLSEVESLVMSLTDVQKLSTRKVAAQLTEHGYQKDGKDYTHNMVNTIIKNNRK